MVLFILAATTGTHGDERGSGVECRSPNNINSSVTNIAILIINVVVLIVYLQMPRHWRGPLFLCAHFLRVVIALITHHVVLLGRIFSPIHGDALPIVDWFALVNFDGGSL